MRARQFVVPLYAVLTAGCVDDPNAAMVEPSAVDVAEGKVGNAKVASLLRVAAAAEASGDQSSAAGLYRSAYRLSADDESPNAAALVGLGRTLAAMGVHDEAVEAFRDALKIRADDPETRRLLGNSLVNLGLPEAAKTQFARALDLHPDARTYNGMGVAHDMAGDHAAAQGFYRTGLGMEPGNLSLRNNLGLSLAIVSRFDEAIEILRRAAADPRAGARHRNNLALAYGLAGRTEAAARINRIYQDQYATNANIAYYRTLRALRDTRETVNALGVHSGGATQVRAAGLPLESVDRDGAERPPESAAARTPVAPAEASATATIPRAPPPAAAADAPPPEKQPLATAAPVRIVKTDADSADAARDGDALVFDPRASRVPHDELVMTPSPEDRVEKVRRRAERPRAAMPRSQAPTAADATPGQYVVQFASYMSRERAETGWKQISRAAKELLDGIRPEVQAVRLAPSAAPHYRLRSEPLRDQQVAQALCRGLEMRRIDCLVIRQPAPAPRPAANGGGSGSPRGPEQDAANRPAGVESVDPDDVFSP